MERLLNDRKKDGFWMPFSKKANPDTASNTVSSDDTATFVDDVDVSETESQGQQINQFAEYVEQPTESEQCSSMPFKTIPKVAKPKFDMSEYETENTDEQMSSTDDFIQDGLIDDAFESNFNFLDMATHPTDTDNISETYDASNADDLDHSESKLEIQDAISFENDTNDFYEEQIIERPMSYSSVGFISESGSYGEPLKKAKSVYVKIGDWLNPVRWLEFLVSLADRLFDDPGRVFLKNQRRANSKLPQNQIAIRKARAQRQAIQSELKSFWQAPVIQPKRKVTAKPQAVQVTAPVVTKNPVAETTVAEELTPVSSSDPVSTLDIEEKAPAVERVASDIDSHLDELYPPSAAELVERNKQKAQLEQKNIAKELQEAYKAARALEQKKSVVEKLKQSVAEPFENEAATEVYQETLDEVVSTEDMSPVALAENKDAVVDADLAQQEDNIDSEDQSPSSSELEMEARIAQMESDLIDVKTQFVSTPLRSKTLSNKEVVQQEASSQEKLEEEDAIQDATPSQQIKEPVEQSQQRAVASVETGLNLNTGELTSVLPYDNTNSLVISSTESVIETSMNNNVIQLHTSLRRPETRAVMYGNQAEVMNAGLRGHIANAIDATSIQNKTDVVLTSHPVLSIKPVEESVPTPAQENSENSESSASTLSEMDDVSDMERLEMVLDAMSQNIINNVLDQVKRDVTHHVKNNAIGRIKGMLFDQVNDEVSTKIMSEISTHISHEVTNIADIEPETAHAITSEADALKTFESDLTRQIVASLDSTLEERVQRHMKTHLSQADSTQSPAEAPEVIAPAVSQNKVKKAQKAKKPSVLKLTAEQQHALIVERQRKARELQEEILRAQQAVLGEDDTNVEILITEEITSKDISSKKEEKPSITIDTMPEVKQVEPEVIQAGGDDVAEAILDSIFNTDSSKTRAQRRISDLKTQQEVRDKLRSEARRQRLELEQLISERDLKHQEEAKRYASSGSSKTIPGVPSRTNNLKSMAQSNKMLSSSIDSLVDGYFQETQA